MNSVPEQRLFFSKLIGSCELCGRDAFSCVMGEAAGKRSDCSACEDLYKQFAGYWTGLTGRQDEIRLIAQNAHARKTLRRVLTSFSYRGVHKPLILPSTIKLEITNRCNLRCQHCLANAGTNADGELPLAAVESVIKQAAQLGVGAAALVGGEPLIRKDLAEIIELICQARLRFSVSTNGTLINQQAVERLKRKNLMKVSVSLDGREPYHNELRRDRRAFAKALAGIKLLAENKIKVAVAMVITKENCLMIEEVIQAAIAGGAAYFVVNDLIPVGRGREIEKSCLSYDEYRVHTARMKEYSARYGRRIKMLWKGMRPEGKSDEELGQFIKSICGAGLTELTIDSQGYVLPCPFLPRTNENILQKSLEEIWYHSPELEAVQRRDDLTGVCGGCSRKLSCSGCRARALAHEKSIKGGDVRCPKGH